MMAPAVSASWGRTFLQNEKRKSGQLSLYTPQTAGFSEQMSASLMISLWAETHAQAGQVSVGESEEHHEGDEPAVVDEEDGEFETRLNVAQHEERDEGQTGHDQQGELQAVLLRLGHREEEQASKFCYPQVPVWRPGHFNVVAHSAAKKVFDFHIM